MNVTLETLGECVKTKRGSQGIRAAAKDIQVSPATLSRIENGHLPDLETFRRVCVWLGADPAQVLGFSSEARSSAPTLVHFKKKKTQDPDTIKALGELIARASMALDSR